MKIILLISPLFLLVFYISASGQLSPGDLHRSHEAYEGIRNCSLCHGIGQKIKAENCLECHKLLAERIRSKEGLHANPGYNDCQTCHVEHHGRDFDLIWWKNGQENFDHSLTGFTLNGKHTQLKCRDCHQAQFILEKDKLRQQNKDLNRTFLGLQQMCLNCHRDEHRAQLSSKCLNCHTTENWKPASRFDHGSSDFALTGKHIQVSCEKCHPAVIDDAFLDDKSFVKFTGMSYSQCSDCHSDPHRTRFGPDCSGCHRTSGWQNYNKQNFNHSLTRYPLEGKHRQVACEKCHPPEKDQSKPAFQKCTDCHPDYHAGQFAHRLTGGSCEECHSVRGFSPAEFTIADHNKTEFPLEGSHLAVPCAACHKETYQGTDGNIMRFRFASTGCKSCHNDPHDGTADNFTKLDGCETCHSVRSWRDISFDHGRTDFPLESGHLTVSCKECHSENENNELLFTSLSQRCQSCHRDPHFGQFAEIDENGTIRIDCEDCHIATRWTDERFDHYLQADFKLEGAHLVVRCEKCHPTVVKDGSSYVLYKPIKSACADCHGNKKFLNEGTEP